MNIRWGVSELWMVKNRHLPLTWPMAYTTPCTTGTAHDSVWVYFLSWSKTCCCNLDSSFDWSVVLSPPVQTLDTILVVVTIPTERLLTFLLRFWRPSFGFFCWPLQSQLIIIMNNRALQTTTLSQKTGHLWRSICELHDRILIIAFHKNTVWKLPYTKQTTRIQNESRDIISLKTWNGWTKHQTETSMPSVVCRCKRPTT